MQALAAIRASTTLVEAAQHAARLQRLTAATRASLEQHVRAEEQELWPLFAEYFTEAEQDHLVGVIIGRTGAEVLQAMLPWVTGSSSHFCESMSYFAPQRTEWFVLLTALSLGKHLSACACSHGAV